MDRACIFVSLIRGTHYEYVTKLVVMPTSKIHCPLYPRSQKGQYTFDSICLSSQTSSHPSIETPLRIHDPQLETLSLAFYYLHNSFAYFEQLGVFHESTKSSPQSIELILDQATSFHPLHSNKQVVRTYVIHLLGTYVTILCNWLIL